MKKILFLSLFLILTLGFYGCGKTNALSWTKPAGSTNLDTLDQARMYIDNAEYNKAQSILNDYLKNNPNSKEGNILYGQAQLGLADVDLASILSALSEQNPTPSLSKLNLVCSASDRGKIYEAADKFIAYSPTDPSDKVIAAFTGLIAYSAIIHDTYDTANNGLLDNTGDLAQGAEAETRWNTMANKENTYLSLAFSSLASLSGDESLQNTITSMNTVLSVIDTAMTAGTPAWADVKSALLSF